MHDTRLATGALRHASIWCYPWDLLAEGPDQSLARIAEAGLTGISLAVSYHSGMLLLPHNPLQKVRFLEDGALYLWPAPERFAGLEIQPRLSALVDDQDPLDVICRAAQRQRLEVTCWTVCCHNTYQGERHPGLVTHNAYGDRYPFALCPSQPAVQAYLEALMRALSTYPVARVQLESCEFMGFQHGFHHEKVLLNLGSLAVALLGLCFCPACRREAETRGVDWAATRAAVQRRLESALEGDTLELGGATLAEAVPELAPYLAMRDDVVTNLVRRLAGVCVAPLSLIEGEPAVLARVADVVGEVTACAYDTEAGRVTEHSEAARRLVGPEMSLAIGLEANPHITPTAENMRAKVRAARAAGADALYFYNYGLMPLRSLGWLRDALRA
ncbi:MAG: hypothetical protein ACYC4R_14700 [Anaerolineae bacterium]